MVFADSQQPTGKGPLKVNLWISLMASSTMDQFSYEQVLFFICLMFMLKHECAHDVTQYTLLPRVSHCFTDLEVAVICQDKQLCTKTGREVDR